MALSESDKDKTYRWRQLQALSSICFNISNNRPDDVFPVETLCIVKEVRPSETRFKYTGYGSIVKDFENGKCLAENVDKRWYYKAKITDLIARVPGPGKLPKKRGRKPRKPEELDNCKKEVIKRETRQSAKQFAKPVEDVMNVMTDSPVSPHIDQSNDSNHEPPSFSEEDSTVLNAAWEVLTQQEEWPTGEVLNQQVEWPAGPDNNHGIEENKTNDDVGEEYDPCFNENEALTDNESLSTSCPEDIKLDTLNEVKEEKDEVDEILYPPPPLQKLELTVNEKALIEKKRRIDEKYKPRKRGRPKGRKSTVTQQTGVNGSNTQMEMISVKIEGKLDDGSSDMVAKKEKSETRGSRRRNRLNLTEHPCEVCPICDRKVPMVNLSTHLHMHEVKRKRNANMKYCNNCHKFVEGSEYKQHKAKHVEDNERGLKCEKCGETCRRQRYKHHFIRCIGPPPYMCYPCGKYYERADRYIFHCRSLHNWDPPEVFDRQWRESDAGKKYLEERERVIALKAKQVLEENGDLSDIEEQVQNLSEELYPSLPKKLQEFLCNKCGAKRTSRAALQDHMVSHIETRDFKCEDCDKTFKTLKALNVHAKYTLMHGNTAKHMCRYCGKCFVLQSQLSTHEKRMHEESAAKVPLPRMHCPHCGKMVLKRNIQVHLKTHSEERPFACDVCGMRFKFTDILKRHMILHTGTRNFHCELCGKSFAQSATLYKHKLTHKNKMPQVSTSLQGQESGSDKLVSQEELSAKLLKRTPMPTSTTLASPSHAPPPTAHQTTTHPSTSHQTTTHPPTAHQTTTQIQTQIAHQTSPLPPTAHQTSPHQTSPHPLNAHQTPPHPPTAHQTSPVIHLEHSALPSSNTDSGLHSGHPGVPLTGLPVGLNAGGQDLHSYYNLYSA